MTGTLVEKLSGTRDLKQILETTVKDLAEEYSADFCQIMLSSPLDPNHTAICEFKAAREYGNGAQRVVLPLSLQGKAFGQFSMLKREGVNPLILNQLRATLAELTDIIRHAQINDVVQRNTFRETFLVEIGNVMAYCLGIGDALFMVVNILGKVLQASRCIFVCTDDTGAGWRCYEYWQQDKVASCQEYRWPTSDSPLVCQTLLARGPIVSYEGQDNSYVTPVQEELKFIASRSALGVPLTFQEITHGCVMVQQCDYRRAWTRSEIDMVQSVADRVAEALSKLPQEKLSREPIMQLHQRTVAVSETAPSRQTLKSVRQALKGALGLEAIPVARKTSAPSPATAAPLPPAAQPAETHPGAPVVTEPAPAPGPAQPQTLADFSPASTAFEPAAVQETPAQEPGKSLSSILGSGRKPSAMPMLDLSGEGAPPAPPWPDTAYASADEMIPPPAKGGAAVPDYSMSEAEASALKAGVDSAWPQSPAAAAPPSASLAGNREAMSPWGDLDAIPTPKGAAGKAGLGAIMSKGRTTGLSSTSPLLASFHRDKGRFQAAPAEHVEHIEGPPLEIDENEARAKLEEILAAKNPTSDYIFATAGVDARTLGRIDGWIAQIESKDKYVDGHACQVAECASAIALEMGLSAQEVNTVRLAALLHDVGKLGTAAQVLQSPEDALEDQELLVMMKHPGDGAALLESFPELKHLCPIVRAHHEEYSGNGYPLGLKGQEIPLAAAIIHVADSYQQMTAKLKYRQPMGQQEALKALTEGAGVQWDPAAVQALIQCLAQHKI